MNKNQHVQASGNTMVVLSVGLCFVLQALSAHTWKRCVLRIVIVLPCKMIAE